MQPTSENIYQCLTYLLEKKSDEVDSMTLDDSTTYTFFDIKTAGMNYTLIQNKEESYFYLSVISQDYTDTISLTRLIDYSLEKSQIFWDVLEMSGIRQYAFNLLLKRGIPNNHELEDIDWSEVRL